jgi:hypothetical protein
LESRHLMLCILPVVAAATVACMRVKVEENRQVAGVIGAGEGVALVAKPQQHGVSSEGGFLDCLEKQLGDTSAPQAETPPATVPAAGKYRLVKHQTFVDSVYPWLEPSTVLIDADFATTLLARPGVREQIAKSGVRYLVSIDGGTSVSEKSGSISCFIAPGAGGCLGVAFWKKQSGYEASVWDLQRGISLGTVGTGVSGNSVFIGALVPLPLVAPVQHTACKRMATELKHFLNGDDH